MDFADCDFSLPRERIATRPRRPRDSAYLLNCLARADAGANDGEEASFRSLQITDLPDLLRAGDVVVLNDTKVIPARLRAIYVDAGDGASAGAGAGAATDKGDGSLGGQTTVALAAIPAATPAVTLTVTLAARLDPTRWHALVRGGRRMRSGARLDFIDAAARVVFCAEIEACEADGLLRLRFDERLAGDALYDMLEGKGQAGGGGEGREESSERFFGSMPLPPYLKRPSDARDLADYQTLFARKRGAVAAPTAGRHITLRLLEVLRARGVECLFITLHVGIGSFKPLRVARIEAHSMAGERVDVAASTLARIARCKERGGRVLAVGTTVVRALESAALAQGYGEQGYCGGGQGGGEQSYGRQDLGGCSYKDETRLYITPGFSFRLVDMLLTNFHQARSTPLVLTCAFAGVACVSLAYRQARADSRYRFFSYGDACLFARERDEV